MVDLISKHILQELPSPALARHMPPDPSYSTHAPELHCLTEKSCQNLRYSTGCSNMRHGTLDSKHHHLLKGLSHLSAQAAQSKIPQIPMVILHLQRNPRPILRLHNSKSNPRRRNHTCRKHSDVATKYTPGNIKREAKMRLYNRTMVTVTTHSVPCLSSTSAKIEAAQICQSQQKEIKQTAWCERLAVIKFGMSSMQAVSPTP